MLWLLQKRCFCLSHLFLFKTFVFGNFGKTEHKETEWKTAKIQLQTFYLTVACFVCMTYARQHCLTRVTKHHHFFLWAHSKKERKLTFLSIKPYHHWWNSPSQDMTDRMSEDRQHRVSDELNAMVGITRSKVFWRNLLIWERKNLENSANLGLDYLPNSARQISFA